MIGTKTTAFLLILGLLVSVFCSCGGRGGKTSGESFSSDSNENGAVKDQEQPSTDKKTEPCPAEPDPSVLSEAEKLSVTETAAGKKAQSHIFADMDGDGQTELFAAFIDENQVYETWFCTSDGKTQKKIHEGRTFMEECDFAVIKTESFIHVALNTYRLMGTEKRHSVFAMQNGEAVCIVWDEQGYLGCSNGEILLTVEDYDGMFDPVTQSLIMHTWKTAYLTFDGETYKEYAASEISEQAFLKFQNAEKLKAQALSESAKEDIVDIDLKYYKRANGVLHIMCNVKNSSGAITYLYYTLRIKDGVLPEKLGEYTNGIMSPRFSAKDPIY